MEFSAHWVCGGERLAPIGELSLLCNTREEEEDIGAFVELVVGR
jgi:hypothetical protein